MKYRVYSRSNKKLVTILVGGFSEDPAESLGDNISFLRKSIKADKNSAVLVVVK